MPHPAETIASTPAPESQQKLRPTVTTIQRMILEGQTPFLMRRQITLSLHKEDSLGDKSNDDGQPEETMAAETLPTNPRRAVICSFPEREGIPGRRFNLSLEEAAHVSNLQQELASLKSQ